jgi:hypothetical protein
MQIVLGFGVIAAMVMAGLWHYYGTATVKRKAAHWLMASAAGDDARDAAVAAAMKQVVRLEADNAEA